MLDLAEAKTALNELVADNPRLLNTAAGENRLMIMLLIGILQELRANAANRAKALAQWKPGNGHDGIGGTDAT